MAEDTNPFSSFGSALGGLLGFGPQAAPAAGGPTDPYDMLSEAEKRRMTYSTLGQLGATLLAAGQKQMPAQRAQILSQLGNIAPNIETSVFRSQQARLMGAQMQEKMREMEELRTIAQVQKDNPEMLAKQLGQEVETIKMASPRALAEAARQRVIQTPEQRERDRINLEIARNQLATGRLLPVGNEVYRYDPQSGGLSRLTPQRELGIGEQAAPQTGAAAEGQPQQQMYPAATIPRNLDYSRAFGLKGAANYYTGKVQGLVGGESRETAEATKAISEINALRNSIITGSTDQVAGRNLKMTQQRAAELIPEGAALFTSPQDAVNKFSTARSLIDSDMKDLELIASDRSPASSADKVKAAQAWRDLKRNRDNISVLIDNLAGSGRAENVSAPARAQPQQQTVQEGTVVVNKQTGARKVLRNGRWEDM